MRKSAKGGNSWSFYTCGHEAVLTSVSFAFLIVFVCDSSTGQ